MNIYLFLFIVTMVISLPSLEDFSTIVSAHLTTIFKKYYSDRKWTKNTVEKLTSFMIEIFEKVSQFFLICFIQTTQ